MTTFERLAGIALIVATLAACGGGGGDAGTSPLGTGTDTGTGTCSPSGSASSSSGASSCVTAANLSLQLSTSSILNTGAVTVTATATTTTASGQALSGAPVSFSVDGGATYTQSSATTDANGNTVAVISIGPDHSQRVITVTATNGSLTTTRSFAITGAALTGTAVPAIIAPGASGKVDFRLVDANGAAMVGQAITVTAGSAASVSATTLINGDYSFTYIAPATAGTLNIIATAGGVTTTVPVTVQSSSSTVPPACVPSSSGCTPQTIVSASVSANPSVVATNTSSTSNRTEIRALFVAANNAPLRNVRVKFDLNGDPNSIGGTLSTLDSTVYTDDNGVATTSYSPGTRSSPTNGVTIRACYSPNDFASGCPNQASTTVTVVSDPLAVTIGSNNVIINGSQDLTYIRRYVVLVVDASGSAKSNVDIVASVDELNYYKGQYINPGAWRPGYFDNQGTAVLAAPFPCANEDVNRNAINESSEDINHSAALEPRKSDVAISIVGSNKTDASGTVVVQVEYPKNVGSWLQMKILISATGVSGTEGRTNWTEILPIPTDTLSSPSAPPFIVSPYGTAVTDQVLNPGPGPMSYPDGTPIPVGASIAPCRNPN